MKVTPYATPKKKPARAKKESAPKAENTPKDKADAATNAKDNNADAKEAVQEPKQQAVKKENKPVVVEKEAVQVATAAKPANNIVEAFIPLE